MSPYERALLFEWHCMDKGIRPGDDRFTGTLTAAFISAEASHAWAHRRLRLAVLKWHNARHGMATDVIEAEQALHALVRTGGL